ncbi:MAG: hypothetical protein ACRCRQ_00795 [Metamycoplasmataceae bacterium]
MRKWEEVWKEQFGSNSEFAFDFTGKKIERNLFQKKEFSNSWDIYYVEKDKCLIVSSEIFNAMPKTWKRNFFINGKEYQFVKNSNKEFEIFLLEKNHDVEPEMLKLKSKYLFEIKEFYDEHSNKIPKKIIWKKENNLKPKEESKMAESIKDNNIKPKETNKMVKSIEEIEKEKQQTYRKRLIEKNYKIWESLYGDEVIVNDFAGTQIIKYEFDMGTKNSWKVDYYDSKTDDVVYIASVENIDKRAGKKTFEINNVEYNVIIVNGKYSIVSSKQKTKLLFSPELLFKEIEKYFPSFLTNQKIEKPEILYRSSLLINLSVFPIDELEKLRILLQGLLKEINIFQDIFIYISDQKKGEIDYMDNDNCYIRIFFNSNNATEQDIKIFNVSVIMKNVLSLVISNLRTIYDLSTSTNFTMFLVNHNKEYKYISWFTSHDIDENEDRPKRMNRGELIVDKFYYDLFTTTKGYKHSFVALRTKRDNNFFLCNIDINNMSDYIDKKLVIDKQRTIRK